MTRSGDEARAGQDAVWVEGHIALEEIVIGISIDQRRDIGADESFFAIRDVNECVKQIDRLLLVFGEPDPRGIERERARQCHRRRIFRIHPRALPERGNRRAHDAFRKSFLVDVRHVEDFEPAGAVRGVEILTAQHEILNVVSAVFVSLLENRTGFEVLPVVIRIGDLVQMAADRGLRLGRFGPDHGV